MAKPTKPSEKQLSGAVIDAKVGRLINPQHVTPDGKVGILIASGNTQISLEFSVSQANTTARGMLAALAQIDQGKRTAKKKK